MATGSQHAGLSAAEYGVPSREELMELRIWDLHYHGQSRHEEMLPYIRRMGIERLFSLDAGSRWGRTPEESRRIEERDNAILEKYKDHLSGIVRIDPGDVDGTLAKMDRWIKNGPCIGIKYSGGNSKGISCDHPNNDPIIRFAHELGAVIYIHSWIKVGGTPRYPGGATRPGEPLPQEVAILAQRFPSVPMVCGHAGGDWELAIPAIRQHKNVYFEFSGGDPWAGSVDFAVQELGADRIVWGSHIPTRSFANEISKLLSSDASKADLKKMFGTNLRKLSAGILRSKGVRVDV